MWRLSYKGAVQVFPINHGPDFWCLVLVKLSRFWQGCTIFKIRYTSLTGHFRACVVLIAFDPTGPEDLLVPPPLVVHHVQQQPLHLHLAVHLALHTWKSPPFHQILHDTEILDPSLSLITGAPPALVWTILVTDAALPYHGAPSPR